jgi:hypothetical protein
MLAGCSVDGGSLSSGASQLASNARPLNLAVRESGAAPVHRYLSPSRMAPLASRGNLLYVSDLGTDDVDVFSYPGGKQIGTLTGFSTPEGMCINKKSDVWIASTSNYQMVEYAHGGTSPIATLTQNNELVADCSIDQSTGDLAVSSICYVNNYHGCISPGSIAIYKKAKGNPMIFTDPSIELMYFCGYDDKGNLFVDGLSPNIFGFEFAELPKGSGTFTNITLNRVVYFPGGVKWDGKYVALGDQNAGGNQTSSIHQVAVSGANGAVVSTTRLAGAEDVAGFWIQSSNVIAGDNGKEGGLVQFWPYPVGGSPSKTITGLSLPGGTAVSLAPL